ncbi:hypothetical protein GB931_07085 [Modestobacter sp. I12A-02628]|uniref:Uncharacterized protein n=1 Tax=Goekera deserti TaxID=2497753 RepID=A0A7K3WAV6_9ACTN|nr:hypothetical protein [Goekera deserti]MPQ97688.1 hypothetical protein [Goekera deserti]NDI47645.1 hypothetical protein [Goekera deserti]NDI47708.1 hypothetical protein [Goekera deserti]NEL53456.1 hypothetical protein [Goekera deserti]
MAPPISDAVVVDVLRRVDQLCAPLVRRLGRPPELPAPERAAWWAEQVSRVAAGVSAAPRFAGKLADLLPLQNTVGSAVQAVVVTGVAGEHGVTAPEERISLLARVLLDRDLPPATVTPLLQRAAGVYADEALGARGERGAARTLWRVARLLGRIDDELDRRPKGRLRHRALAVLPVVGVVGGYAAEHEGLRRAARQADALLTGR